MQKIAREEALAIRKNLRGVNVTVTNRHSKSKAKDYFVESSPYVNKFLEKMRSQQVIEHYE